MTELHTDHKRTHERLIDAIQNQQVLYFCYKDGQLRIIEPHCYWRTSFGALLLRAYQRSGYSESGAPTGWKTFRVDRLLAFEPSRLTYDGPRPGYAPFNQTSVSRYFAFIPPEMPEYMSSPPLGL